MISTTAIVGEPVYGYVSAATSSMEYEDGWEVYKNGARIEEPSITVSREGPTDFFTLAFTPTSTGKYYINMFDTEVLYVEVVTKSLYTMVRNIEDEALGSWTWDKNTGELKLLKQDGTPLASFDVVDTQLTASRERTA